MREYMSHGPRTQQPIPPTICHGKSLYWFPTTRYIQTPPLPKTLNIFFVGDIVGQPGLDIAVNLVPNYLKKYSVDLLIINGENATEGKGIAEEHAKKIFELGTHVITTGNHVWDRWDSRKVLGADRRILRPLNYPRENGGNGFIVVDLGEKGKVGGSEYPGSRVHATH